MAAEEVKQEIERIGPKEGKMFGVLVVTQGDGSFVTSQISQKNRPPVRLTSARTAG